MPLNVNEGGNLWGVGKWVCLQIGDIVLNLSLVIYNLDDMFLKRMNKWNEESI